ncbi:MAG TPA: DNA ligase D, partial [Burkholderiaceae bacterium]
GNWEPLGNPEKDYRSGHLKFALHGQKLHGNWALIRMKPHGEKQEAWLLIKEKDDYARPAQEFSVVDEMPDSVAGAQKRRSKGTVQPAKQTRKSAISRAGKNQSMPEGAKKTALPARLNPQLATLVEEAPGDGKQWQYEIKFDGYRMLARAESGDVRLHTRTGLDWTDKLPELAKSLAKMKLPDGWYDGEIVALDEHDIPDFQRLQNAFDRARTSEVVYYLFDLPFYHGHDLREVPLLERRRILHSLFNARTPASIRFSQGFDVDGTHVKDDACRLGLEGVIGKRIDSHYTERRSRSWIKLKCGQRQEFVIGGYTDPQGTRSGLGSLLLGIHDDKHKLHYAGNVGTGFNDKTLAALRKQLDANAAEKSPFDGPTGIYRTAHWVKPVMLAEVSFAAWTADGRIRHGVFHALRQDKKAGEVVRERPKHIPNKTAATDAKETGLLAAQKVTHPDRVIDEHSGLTKIELMRFYALVAPLMLPHLKGRPASLLRAPDGVGGQFFFQKHLGDISMAGVRMLPPDLDPEHPPMLEIFNAQGLLSATQMNVIEFHTWNAVKSKIGKPDRMTFDLDPGEKTDWDLLRQAATLVRSLLAALELESMIKTSGGKGLHIVVPIKRQYEWGAVKGFSHAIVEHLAATLPQLFAAKSGPKNRIGKVFVDYLRNGFGATTVSAWSARARPGMGVSVPFGWDDLEKIKSGAHWHVRNIHDRLDVGNKPWEQMKNRAQGLTRPMKILGFKPDGEAARNVSAG